MMMIIKMRRIFTRNLSQLAKKLETIRKHTKKQS